MFQELHELAKQATLLVAITTEGEQLRVSITPAPADSKGKQPLRPLSLLGTPAELDEGLGAALIAWQSPPKKSLMDQVLGGTDGSDGAKPPAAARDVKPAASKAKPGPKPKTKPSDDGQAEAGAAAGDAGQAGLDAAGTGSDALSTAAATAAASLPALSGADDAAADEASQIHGGDTAPDSDAVDLAPIENTSVAKANDPYTIDMLEAGSVAAAAPVADDSGAPEQSQNTPAGAGFVLEIF